MWIESKTEATLWNENCKWGMGVYYHPRRATGCELSPQLELIRPISIKYKKIKKLKFTDNVKQSVYIEVFKDAEFKNGIYFVLRSFLHCASAWFLFGVSSIRQIVVGWIFGNIRPWMRPASLPFPRNLDTNLNSKLCWPNLGGGIMGQSFILVFRAISAFANSVLKFTGNIILKAHSFIKFKGMTILKKVQISTNHSIIFILISAYSHFSQPRLECLKYSCLFWGEKMQ